MSTKRHRLLLINFLYPRIMFTFGNYHLQKSNDDDNATFVSPSSGHLLALAGGILWGVSTPLMKGQSSQLVTWQQKSKEQSFFLHAFSVLGSLASSWKVSGCGFFVVDSQVKCSLLTNFSFSLLKFLACFGLNQLGSVFYTASLSYNPITISVPISNSVNLAIIVLLGCYKEKITLNWRKSSASLFTFLLASLIQLIAHPLSSSSFLPFRFLRFNCWRSAGYGGRHSVFAGASGAKLIQKQANKWVLCLMNEKCSRRLLQFGNT